MRDKAGLKLMSQVPSHRRTVLTQKYLPAGAFSPLFFNAFFRLLYLHHTLHHAWKAFEDDFCEYLLWRRAYILYSIENNDFA